MTDLDPKEENMHVNPIDGPPEDYAEFEIGKHRVPWFLWVFFSLIISWASISWIKFFGY